MSLKNHIYKPQISFNHRLKISRNEILLIEFIVLVFEFLMINRKRKKLKKRKSIKRKEKELTRKFQRMVDENQYC